MHLRDLVTVSVGSLRRSIGRTLLSMLGIVIGIASVILVLSIGQAAQGYILNQINSLGSNLLFVESGQPLQNGGTPSPIVKEVIKEKDYKDIIRQSWIEKSAAIVLKQDSVTSNGQTMNISVWGTSHDDQSLFDTKLISGIFLTKDDVDARSRVAILGYSVAQKLFGFDDPVGKSVKVNTTSYHVIGVAGKVGTRFGQDMDKMIYVPYTAAMDAYGLETIMEIIVKPTIPSNQAVIHIQDIIRENHNITDPKKDDFRVVTQEDAIKITTQVIGVLQLFLSAVAAISLVVGGIGIMNIMYVSVTERTREIGLRKSLGAKQSNIQAQFLMEAIFLTTIGGIIGTLLGVALTWIAIQIILHYQTGWSFTLSPQGILWGVGVSMGTGLIFGYFPARRAAALHPIEALRYE
ncbi:MAG: ABC transporter permease [Patescibacteria group bacterium]